MCSDHNSSILFGHRFVNEEIKLEDSDESSFQRKEAQKESIFLSSSDIIYAYSKTIYKFDSFWPIVVSFRHVKKRSFQVFVNLFHKNFSQLFFEQKIFFSKRLFISGVDSRGHCRCKTKCCQHTFRSSFTAANVVYHLWCGHWFATFHIQKFVHKTKLRLPADEVEMQRVCTRVCLTGGRSFLSC